MLGISPVTQSSGSDARSRASTASCTRDAMPAAARPAASTSSARSSIARGMRPLGAAPSRPCGRPAPRHARGWAGSGCDTARDCRPAKSGLARRNALRRAARRPTLVGLRSARHAGASSGRCASGDLLAGLGPVGEERGEAFVGQRMIEQRAQHRRRQRGDMGAHFRRLDHVHRAAHGGDQHLGLEIG